MIWARRRWAGVSRAVGLSLKSDTTRRRWWLGRDRGSVLGVSQTARVVSWTDARLCSATASGEVLTLTIRARPGGSSADVTAKAQAVAAMAGARSVTFSVLSPSTVELRLVMREVLVGTRTSAPLPATDGSVVLGRTEDGTDVCASVFQPWHMAVQGATRSGKSALCYGLLGAYASRADVLVCGLDPSGILLGPFTQGRGKGWIATGTADLPTHADAVAGVVAEMDRRISLLAACGLDKLTDFGPDLPVLLVVLEEYPGLLAAARTDDDAYGRTPGSKVAPSIERAVGRLTKEGAKVGVVLLVLAQRMSAKAVDTDDRSNYGLRVTLRVDNGDAVTMLHDGLDRSLIEEVRQFPPGMGLIEAPGRPVARWRADYTAYPDYLSRVAQGIAHTDLSGSFCAIAADTCPPTTPETPGDMDTSNAAPAMVEPAELRHPSRATRKPRARRTPRDSRPTASPSSSSPSAPSASGGEVA